MKREFGEVHLTIPKLPQQQYAVVIVCQLPDDRKGRCVARIRKPEYLPLQYFPRNRVGCLKEKNHLLENVFHSFPVWRLERILPVCFLFAPAERQRY